MVYSRFSKNSDTYTVVSINIQCIGCKLADKNNVNFESLEDLLIHLIKHRKFGHLVPKYVLNNVIKDLENA